MKRIYLYVITLASVFLLMSCGKNNVNSVDTTPPSAPTGLSILNGDNVVTISWNYNPERDVAGYDVYYSYDDVKFTLIGSTKNNYYDDYGAKNGYTYYYAVAAYDYNGNLSDLSKQSISATPRPEGFNQSISDYIYYPDIAGFSFSTYTIVPYNSSNVDFYYEIYNGTTPYIDLRSGSLIEDMGATNDIYDVAYAPSTGWATDAVAIVGHTYVIWTYDNYYAKIRISNIVGSRLIFDWAFQTVQGDTQLKISNVPTVNNRLKNKLVSRN
jgi:hypothetical protein